MLLLTPDQWHEMLNDMLALSWKDVIGDERERSLLEVLVDIILDCWFGGIREHLDLAGDGPEGIDPGKFQKAVYQELADDWEGGHLVEHGYTLDDFTSLSSRLARLTSDQWLEMLKDLLSPPTSH